MKYVIKALLCVSIFGNSTNTMQPQAQAVIGLMNVVSPGLFQTAVNGVACGGIVPFVGGVLCSTLGEKKRNFLVPTLWGMTTGGVLGAVFHLFFSTYSTGRAASVSAKLVTTVLGLTVGCLALYNNKT